MVWMTDFLLTDPRYIAGIYNTMVHTQEQFWTVNFRSDFPLMNDTPYLTFTDELWGVFRDFFKEKLSWHIENTLLW